MGGRKVECKEMGKEHYSHTGKDPVSGRHGTEMFDTLYGNLHTRNSNVKGSLVSTIWLCVVRL